MESQRMDNVYPDNQLLNVRYIKFSSPFHATLVELEGDQVSLEGLRNQAGR